MGAEGLEGVAMSYSRFSSRKQERGDSIRRQTALREAWLARNPGVRFDTALAFFHVGSAYRGKHRLKDTAALKQLIRAVEGGRIKPGTYLIVESFDRLTREEFGEAAEFVLGLINRGIRIVQLAPAEVILQKPVDLMQAMI